MMRKLITMREALESEGYFGRLLAVGQPGACS
jgi:hypothetical protein